MQWGQMEAFANISGSFSEKQTKGHYYKIANGGRNSHLSLVSGSF